MALSLKKKKFVTFMKILQLKILTCISGCALEMIMGNRTQWNLLINEGCTVVHGHTLAIAWTAPHKLYASIS